MRYLILSDIHGSPDNLKSMLAFFDEHKFDFLILLGDLLYHGPRNPLPQGHAPSEVAACLNAYCDKIIACRGNCDCEVDQMVLNFPCLGDYSLIVDEGISIFATHGHLYTPETFPRTSATQIFLSGHTHLWELRQDDTVFICNPGSLSLPKENRPPTYATYEKGTLAVYDLNHTLLSTLKLPS